MNRKTGWILGILALVVGVPGTWMILRTQRNASALQEEVRLARAEGLPATGQEFAQTIPKVPASQNAAPFYRQLEAALRGKRIEQPAIDLLDSGDPTALKTAVTAMVANQDTLDLLARATNFSGCWFDRDWSIPSAVILPEYAYMKSGARLLSLRGTLAAKEGRATDAIQDVRRVFTISRHAGAEGFAIAAYVRDAIYLMGLRRLAMWCYAHPNEQVYRDELRKAIAAFPKPNMKAENRDMLVNWLSFQELTETRGGWEKIGVKEEYLSPLDRVMPFVVDQGAAKVKIVAAIRKQWTALNTGKAGQEEFDRALAEKHAAMLAFPSAADIYTKLMSEEDHWFYREDTWIARRQMYTAALRAMEQSPLPRKIKTEDLLSPYDGKPLRYRLNGKQIIIEVSSAANNDGALKLPPDKKKP